MVFFEVLIQFYKPGIQPNAHQNKHLKMKKKTNKINVCYINWVKLYLFLHIPFSFSSVLWLMSHNHESWPSLSYKLVRWFQNSDAMEGDNSTQRLNQWSPRVKTAIFQQNLNSKRSISFQYNLISSCFPSQESDRFLNELQGSFILSRPNLVSLNTILFKIGQVSLWGCLHQSVWDAWGKRL